MVLHSVKTKYHIYTHSSKLLIFILKYGYIHLVFINATPNVRISTKLHRRSTDYRIRFIKGTFSVKIEGYVEHCWKLRLGEEAFCG